MSVTAQTLAVDALPYIGVFAVGAAATPWEKFQAARAAILARIARDQTAAIQDIYRARSDLYQTRIGAQVSAPEVQYVTLTAGSATVTLGMAYANNLDGASVNVGGIWTETRQPTSGGEVTLLHPYPGPSGVYPMTVFGDSILIDTSLYSRVTGNVERDGVPLVGVPNREALKNVHTRRCSDYGASTRRVGIVHRHPGEPLAYWIESALGSAGPNMRLRLAPLPDRFYSLDLDVELRAPVITAADLADTDGTDPGTTFRLPDGLDESILSAIFLARWCKSSWFKDEDARKFLVDDAAAAMVKLKAFTPQAQTGAAIHMRGYV